MNEYSKLKICPKCGYYMTKQLQWSTVLSKFIYVYKCINSSCNNVLLEEEVL